MIRVDSNGFEMKGTGLQIKAEAVMAMRYIMNNHVVTEEELHEFVHLAATPREEIAKDLEEKLDKTLKSLIERDPESFEKAMDEFLKGKF